MGVFTQVRSNIKGFAPKFACKSASASCVNWAKEQRKTCSHGLWVQAEHSDRGLAFLSPCLADFRRHVSQFVRSRNQRCIDAGVFPGVPMGGAENLPNLQNPAWRQFPSECVTFHSVYMYLGSAFQGTKHATGIDESAPCRVHVKGKIPWKPVVFLPSVPFFH